MRVKITGLLSLILFLVFTILGNIKENRLADQQAAKRWSKEGGSAQVTVFIEKGITVDDFMIRSFENALDRELQEAAVEAENEHARLYVSAYSAQGKMTLKSEHGSLETSAIGIGKDFFYFHPLPLVNGRYFSGEELMKDFVLIDEEAAWQLFGSSDIEGMTVMIQGVPHTVAGVVQRDSSKLARNAGVEKSIVYVSYETLLELGESEGISCYEVVGANPVKGLLAKIVREKFGLKEDQMLVVENSSRFTVEALIPVLLSFGSRSMQNNAMTIPYWENMARGTEDVLALFLLIRFLCLLVMGSLGAGFLILKWKHRKDKEKEFWKRLGGIYEKKSVEIRNHLNRKHSSDDGLHR